MHSGFFFGIGFFILLWPLIAVAGFIFWLRMLVDAISRNDYKSDTDKLVWVLVVIFLNFLGALIYFFLIKNKSLNNNDKI